MRCFEGEVSNSTASEADFLDTPSRGRQLRTRASRSIELAQRFAAAADYRNGRRRCPSSPLWRFSPAVGSKIILSVEKVFFALQLND